MDVRCFFMEPTGRARRSLVRSSKYDSGVKCPSRTFGGHRAEVTFDEIDAHSEAHITTSIRDHVLAVADFDNPLWEQVAVCACGHHFTADDEYVVSCETLYTRTDTGELLTTHDAPWGAMMYMPWMERDYAPGHWDYRGPDGRCLQVNTPGGWWVIDNRASNCTMKDDTTHRCWVRHGVVPDITVDKNGHTCSAGAGSIAMGDRYHGFLRNGWLTDCPEVKDA